MNAVAEVPTSVFGAARARALEKALPAGAFLKAEERHAWHESGQMFWIIKAEITNSRDYGERATFTVVTDPALAENGEFKTEPRTLDLDSNNVRAALIEELTPIIATTRMVGPVYLTQHKTASGNPAWDITDVPPTAQAS